MGARFVEYHEATAEVKAIYDDIMKVRGFAEIPEYYKALAIDPTTLAKIWSSARDMFRRSKIDALTKEMIAIAVFSVLGADYCLTEHVKIAQRLGMDDEKLGELVAAIGVFAESSAVSRTLGLQAK
jgi:AhpD family alkylhydroperoxidase